MAPRTGCQSSATGRRRKRALDGEQPSGDERGQQPARHAEAGVPGQLGRDRRSRAVARRTAGRSRRPRRGRPRRRSWPPRAGRTPASRTRTAAARWPARRRPAAPRTSPPCRRRRRWPAGSCVRGRDVEDLAEQRPDGAAGDDDRPLGAERVRRSRWRSPPTAAWPPRSAARCGSGGRGPLPSPRGCRGRGSRVTTGPAATPPRRRRRRRRRSRACAGRSAKLGASHPHRWKRSRLVNSPMRWTSTHAAPPAARPRGRQAGQPEVGDPGHRSTQHDAKYRGTT